MKYLDPQVTLIFKLCSASDTNGRLGHILCLTLSCDLFKPENSSVIPNLTLTLPDPLGGMTYTWDECET